MTRKENLLRQYQENQHFATLELHRLGFRFLLPEDIWHILLIEYDKTVDYADIFHMELTAEQIVKTTVDFLKKKGPHLGSINISIDIDAIDFNDVAEFHKATIKVNNVKWRIHQNDADSFPSIPHAHDYQNNLTLSLITGELFRKRKLVGRLPANNFERVLDVIRTTHPRIHDLIERGSQ